MGGSETQNTRPSTVATSSEFLMALGQITWLMGLSNAHRDIPVRDIEARVQAPLMLKQVRVYTKGNQPVAAVIWASVSESIKQALRFDTYKMNLPDWRSGEQIVVVETISPFVDGAKFEKMFLEQVKDLQPQVQKAELK